MGRSRLAFVVTLAAVGLAPACTDPVRDAEIAALGDEDPAVATGPDHRPGQPCLHCHSRGGPAEDRPFVIAGTVYETEAFDAKPAVGVRVQFVDAADGAPRVIPETNAAGNFFVREGEWPDLAFPVRVGLYDDVTKPPKQTMRSLVNREGSCNFCHRANRNPALKPTAAELAESTRSAGQIYFRTGGS